jgi:putative flippase GtrA
MTEFLKKLKQNKFLSEFLTLKSMLQFAKYITVGVSAFAIEYLSFRLIYFYTNGNHLNISNSLSMAIGFVFSFILNRVWSFNSKEVLSKQLTMMIILFFINLSLSNIIISLINYLTPVPASIAKLMVMVLVIMWNFIIYKKIIYRK